MYAVAEHPAMFITGCLYIVGEYFFVFSLMEPSAFRICQTYFSGFVSTGVFFILLLFLFFQGLLSVSLSVFVDLFFERFIVGSGCFLCHQYVLCFLSIGASLYMC